MCIRDSLRPVEHRTHPHSRTDKSDLCRSATCHPEFTAVGHSHQLGRGIPTGGQPSEHHRYQQQRLHRDRRYLQRRERKPLGHLSGDDPLRPRRRRRQKCLTRGPLQRTLITSDGAASVSYTHLDVYKRQELAMPQGGSRFGYSRAGSCLRPPLERNRSGRLRSGSHQLQYPSVTLRNGAGPRYVLRDHAQAPLSPGAGCVK